MKKTLCIVLITAMLLSLMPLAVFADTTPTGTAISTMDELKAMSASGTYYLADDITISGSWDYATPFAGTLDGDGHTIYLADGVTLAGGLFRELKNCTIKNLNIKQLGNATYNTATSQTLNNTIEGIGALAALAYGDDKGDVACTITNVSIYANITASDRNVGGFIGEVRYSALQMDRCVFDGSITSTGGENNYGTAGMVGGSWQRSYKFNIIDCINYATITAEGYAAGIFGANRVGGYNNDNCFRNTRIQYCINYGDITTTKSEYAGGMFAVYRKNDASVEVRFKNNINYGAITAPTDTGKAGGVGGGFRSNNDNGTAQLMGNINYGAITGSWSTNTVANPYNGSIQTRQYNYCSTAISGGYGADVITDAAAVISTLNNAGFDGARPQIYTLLPNGKITLTWAYTDATLVGVQLSEIAGEQGSETRSIRFVGGIGEEFGDLDNLGIIIVAIDSNGNRIKMFEGKTDTVYKTLKAGGEDVYAEDYSKTYFYTAVVNNIPVSLGELTFELIPFEIADGVVTYGYQGSVTVDLAKVETPAA